MSLGERIRQARIEKGMTQTELAGGRITRNMLSQIENGLATPSMKTLGYLAQTLGVTVGSLLEEEDGSALSGARSLLKSKKYAEAVKAAEECGAHGDEYESLLARGYAAMAAEAFQTGDLERTTRLAQEALSHEAATVYRTREIEVQMRLFLAHCAIGTEAADACMEDYRAVYEEWGWEARHHLLQARYHLSREQTQLAEREIWTITALPEEEKAHYLLLRGWLAIRQEKYSSGISFLKQAEELGSGNLPLQRVLYRLLETAYRELEDFKYAYEYAAKQREI